MHLRQERPDLGIFAMYNHKGMPFATYNPSRLLCRYVGGSSRILLVGSGFVKQRDEPIQANASANREAVVLSTVGKELDARIECGEIAVMGSRLIPQSPESFNFI